MPRRPAPSTGDAARDAKNAKERERRRQRAPQSAISGPHQQQEEGGSASSSGAAAAVSEEASTIGRCSSSLSQVIVLPGGANQRSVILKVVDGSNNSNNVKIFSYIDLIRCHLKQENIEVHNDYDRNTLHKICEIYGTHEPYEEVGVQNPRHVLSRILTPEQQTGLAVHYHQFEGERQRKTPCGTLQSCVELMMLLPGKTGAAVRRAGAQAIIGILGGDENIIKQVQECKRVQEYLARNDENNPWRVFATIPAVGSQSMGAERMSSVPLQRFTTTAVIALPEPFLDWQKDIGASRKETPAAKAALKLLFEIEIAAGALPKNTKLNLNQPQMQYLALAKGALATSKASIQTRIDTIAARNSASAPEEERCQPSFSLRPEKRLRMRDEEDCDADSDISSEDNILKVSEVMRAAAVWEPVWKPYMSDLSNRMLQLKCHDTDGSFSERRYSTPFGLVHKYKKPEDWSMACQSLHETKSLYEKRIRELLEDAFVRAGTYDGTLAFACSEAARRLAIQLRTADLDA